MVSGGHQEIFSAFCFLANSSLPALRTLELCLKHYDVDKSLFLSSTIDRSFILTSQALGCERNIRC
jgi:hypothetical protein